MKKLAFLAAVVALSAGTVGAQVTLVNDTFESYADTSALEAVWVPSVAAVHSLTTLAADGAEGSDKYMTIANNAAFMARSFTQTPPTAGSEIVLTGYLRSTSWANSRAAIQLRDSALSAALYASIGTNNDVGSFWKVRALGYSPNVAYAQLTTAGAPTPAVWNKLVLRCGLAEITTAVNDVETESFVTAYPVSDGFAVVRTGYGNTANIVYDVDSVSVVSNPTSVSDWDLMQ
jgi:hypothetical protein